MKHGLLSVSIALSIFVSPLAFAGNQNKAENSSYQSDAKVTGVFLEADNCGACQNIKTDLAAAQKKHEFSGFNLISIDYTDQDDTAFWAAVDSTGYGSQLREKIGEKPQIGAILLIDNAQGKVVNMITMKQSVEEVAATINEALS